MFNLKYILVKKFNWQVFISINLFVSFFIMFISGIVLYIKPEGSVARWLNWDFLFLSKSVWESVHTFFSFLFIVFALFHIFLIHLLNIRNYLKINKNGYWKESFIAILIGLLFFIGTAADQIPFRSVYQFGDKLSSGWSNQIKIQTALDPRESLNEIIKKESVSTDSVMKMLDEKGISPDQSLAKAADKMGIKPFKLYMLIRSEGDEAEDKQNAVYENIKIEEVVLLYPLSQEELLTLLKKKGKIEFYNSETTIKELSDQLAIPPENIISYIRENVEFKEQ